MHEEQKQLKISRTSLSEFRKFFATGFLFLWSYSFLPFDTIECPGVQLTTGRSRKRIPHHPQVQSEFSMSQSELSPHIPSILGFIHCLFERIESYGKLYECFVVSSEEVEMKVK